MWEVMTDEHPSGGGGPRATLRGGECIAQRGDLIGFGAVLRTDYTCREACRDTPVAAWQPGHRVAAGD